MSTIGPYDLNDKPVQVRKACGHYAPLGEKCPTCSDEGDMPDPWLIAGEDINLNRQAETRAYRQSKFRGREDDWY